MKKYLIYKAVTNSKGSITLEEKEVDKEAALVQAKKLQKIILDLDKVRKK